MEQELVQTEDQAIRILLTKMEEAKARNPRLSLRGFADRLGMSSGALSEIFKGKRSLTPQIKKKIADKLNLSPEENQSFFESDLPNKMHTGQDTRLQLSQDQYHLISDWWYFALLCLHKTKGFRPQMNWMARRLGLAANVVSEAWDRLFRLGYLEKQGQKIVQKQPDLKTTDDLLDLSIRKSHLEDLRLIENSLLEVPIALRDNTSHTFVIDKKDLPKAKQMIRVFHKQMMKQLSKDTGEEVYKISIALYPLTQVDQEQ